MPKSKTKFFSAQLVLQTPLLVKFFVHMQ